MDDSDMHSPVPVSRYLWVALVYEMQRGTLAIIPAAWFPFTITLIVSYSQKGPQSWVKSKRSERTRGLETVQQAPLRANRLILLRALNS